MVALCWGRVGFKGGGSAMLGIQRYVVDSVGLGGGGGGGAMLRVG